MKNTKFLNTLKSDFKRSFCSPKFLIAVLLIPTMCFVAMGNDGIRDWLQSAGNYSCCLYYFDLLTGLFQFRTILLVISAIPFVTSFCNDWNNKYIMPLSVRTGISKYCISKMIVGFISSLSVTFIGLFLYIFILAIKVPFYNPTSTEELVTNNVFLDLFGDIGTFSLFAAFWFSFALMLSALLPNKFLASAASFIGFYLWDTVITFLPYDISKYIDTRAMSNFDVMFRPDTVGMPYACFFFIVISAVFGLFFYNIVKRRLGNELV